MSRRRVAVIVGAGLLTVAVGASYARAISSAAERMLDTLYQAARYSTAVGKVVYVSAPGVLSVTTASAPGATGATGPTGATGVTGATGPAGPGSITSTLTCPSPTGSDPANPATGAIFYCKLAGGKVSWNVRFPSGAAQQVAIEP